MEKPANNVEILSHRNTEEVLIIRFVYERRGSLEALFSYGNMYRHNKEDIKTNAWNIISEILAKDVEKNNNNKSEYDFMSSAKRNKYRGVSVTIYPSEVTIAPLEKVRGGYSGKIMFRLNMPIDVSEFNEKLNEAFEEAS